MRSLFCSFVETKPLSAVSRQARASLHKTCLYIWTLVIPPKKWGARSKYVCFDWSIEIYDLYCVKRVQTEMKKSKVEKWSERMIPSTNIPWSPRRKKKMLGFHYLCKMLWSGRSFSIICWVRFCRKRDSIVAYELREQCIDIKVFLLTIQLICVLYNCLLL